MNLYFLFIDFLLHLKRFFPILWKKYYVQYFATLRRHCEVNAVHKNYKRINFNKDNKSNIFKFPQALDIFKLNNRLLLNLIAKHDRLDDEEIFLAHHSRLSFFSVQTILTLESVSAAEIRNNSDCFRCDRRLDIEREDSCWD